VGALGVRHQAWREQEDVEEEVHGLVCVGRSQVRGDSLAGGGIRPGFATIHTYSRTPAHGTHADAGPARGTAHRALMWPQSE
jgi:hypothetical protein